MKTTELKLQLLEFLSTIQGLPKFDIFPILQPVEVESDKTFYFTQNSFGKTKDAGFGYRIEFERTINLDRFFFLGFHLPSDIGDVGDVLALNNKKKLVFAKTLLKLEENLTFTVGDDKMYKDIKIAINDSLNYYPNADFKITVLIDAGYEITEPLIYKGVDFSHVILSTTGFITSNTFEEETEASATFYFNSCWLPEFNNFLLDKEGDFYSTAIYIRSSSSGFIKDCHIKGFSNTFWCEQTFGFYIDNVHFQPVCSTTETLAKNNIRHGLRIQNSVIDLRSFQIDSDADERGYYVSGGNIALNATGASMVNLRSYPASSTTSIIGNFHRGIMSNAGSIVEVEGFTEISLELGEEEERKCFDLYVNIGTINLWFDDNLVDNLTTNIPCNVVSNLGVIYSRRVDVPFSYVENNYKLSYLKAPIGESHYLVIDDEGNISTRS